MTDDTRHGQLTLDCPCCGERITVVMQHTPSLLPSPKVDTSSSVHVLSVRADDPEAEASGERFGAGVCATGRCIEPCGRFGGCAR